MSNASIRSTTQPPANGSLFADGDLADYVSDVHGPDLGERLVDILNDYPVGTSAFVDSIRRSVTREIHDDYAAGARVGLPRD